MNKKISCLVIVVLLTVLSGSLNKVIGESFSGKNPGKNSLKVIITVDKTIHYQTIDGFGFFGACDVWWNSAGLWNPEWGEKVISDLGITIWRNEWFPPSFQGEGQDAIWDKQKPVIQGLKLIADRHGVDLKYIVTVWSPPADMKINSTFTWSGDEKATRGGAHNSTKKGGTLDPGKYADYAGWLKTCLKTYRDAGINIYALSLQNEPAFVEPYNSCTYTTRWYCDLLNHVTPMIKADYPSVKIFGSENMLEMEGKSTNYSKFYHQMIKNTAGHNLDILAVHGYSDGVAASSGSALAQMWTNHKEQFSAPLNKPAWMTETSGYVDSWLGTGTKPGALNLAMDIYSGLNYGNMQAWVWWQGSQAGGIGEYNLMSNNTAGKKYYVSKHYYRYIRPGAVRIKAASTATAIYITAFEHAQKGTHTLVIINRGTEMKSIVVKGSDLPDAFMEYLTTSGDENCKQMGMVKTGSAFDLPAGSIVTLQAGGDAL